MSSGYIKDLIEETLSICRSGSTSSTLSYSSTPQPSSLTSGCKKPDKMQAVQEHKSSIKIMVVKLYRLYSVYYTDCIEYIIMYMNIEGVDI